MEGLPPTAHNFDLTMAYTQSSFTYGNGKVAIPKLDRGPPPPPRPAPQSREDRVYGFLRLLLVAIWTADFRETVLELVKAAVNEVSP